MDEGDLALEKHAVSAALKAYAGAEALAPEIPEMTYWHAVTLVGLKRVDEALPLFKKVFAKEPRWREFTPRVAKAGLLPEGPVLDQILAVGK
jgi:hypothetical protein